MSQFSATILTLFPEMFPGPLAHSLAGKALKNGIWALNTLNIRDFATDKHQKVDETPYGGGAGMVMRADVIDSAICEAKRQQPDARLLYMTPRGTPLTQPLVQELCSFFPLPAGEGQTHRSTPTGQPLPPALSQRERGVIILCGRYEGIDERVIEKHQPLEISVGDYVLSGGELAAMLLLDACLRLIPGIMGDEESHAQESFGTAEDYALLLEYPHYTKPPSWNEAEVPDILLSGHHANIETWRLQQAESATKNRRPDLWERYVREGKKR